MKKFLILACFLVTANALSKELVEQFMNKLQEIGEKCVGETQASDDDVADLIAHKVPPTHEGKCMIFCFYKAFKMQNTDGTLNPQGALESLEPLKADDAELYSKILKVFQSCGAKVDINADPCITAAELAECGKAEGKAMGLTSDLLEL